MKRIFSWVKFFTNLKRCCLQIDFKKKLIFVNKNWPNDPTASYKSSYNLVGFIEVDGDLNEDLEEFEGVFGIN
jgi:hypothetical protein